MKFLLTILLSILFSCILYTNNILAQENEPNNYKLYVQLKNAPFDSLFLHDYTAGRNIIIAGKKIKKFTWEITIPVNVVNDSENMELLASPYGDKNNSMQSVRFLSEKKGKSLILVNIGLEDKNNYIYASFRDTTTFNNERVFKNNNVDSIVFGKLICADFNLEVKDYNSDIAIRSIDPLFSWFMDVNGDKISYDDHLKKYIELSKKFPDSRFLISNLSANLQNYKTKEDVFRVYKNFSNKHKITIWAKHIDLFLSTNKFLNSYLSVGKDTIKQLIIQDSSKYNLIIFSASWCKPCIEEIPIFKNIYMDLGKNLILTSISLDDLAGILAFKNLLIHKNIPWRSLYAYEDIKKIKEKYFIETIPHSILVYPNLNMEVLDVRNQEDYKKLYNTINQINEPKN